MNYSLLLIDNEPVIVEGLKILVHMYLKQVGAIFVANSGEEGLKLALEHRPDVIISDIRMGKMSGLEMIETLQAHGIHSHFILISGYEDFAYARKAIGLGVEDYLTKPVEEEALVKAWNKATEKIREESRHGKRGENGSTAEILDEYCMRVHADQIPFGIISTADSSELELALEYGDFAGAEQLLERIFAKLYDCSCSYEEMRNVSFKLVSFGVQKYADNVEQARQIVSRFESLDSFKNRRQLYSFVVDVYGQIVKKNVVSLDGDKNDVVTLVKEYIKSHFSKNISLTDIADTFAINPTYFSELFKKKTGITYKNYLTLVRVHQAKKLLTDTDMRIYEICEAVGYSDVNNLNRVFEKEYGIKPSDYRKRWETTENRARMGDDAISNNGRL